MSKSLEEKDYKIKEENMFYHITKKDNLCSIKENGLIPSIGNNAHNFGEIEKAVYLFSDNLTAFDAYSNWFGDCFEEDEDVIILELNEELIKDYKYSEAKYEILVSQKIPYEAIVSIKDANNPESYVINTTKMKI